MRATLSPETIESATVLLPQTSHEGIEGIKAGGEWVEEWVAQTRRCWIFDSAWMDGKAVGRPMAASLIDDCAGALVIFARGLSKC